MWDTSVFFITVAAMSLPITDTIAIAAVVRAYLKVTRIPHVHGITRTHAVQAHPVSWAIHIGLAAGTWVQSAKKHSIPVKNVVIIKLIILE